jgi:drug/metabolite transporter (DMT)-like permease
MPGSSAWLAVLVLGVLCTGVAYVLFFWLIENVGPARSLTVTFVVPVFAVIYGAVFLQETISLWMLLCAAIIVCGTALSANLIRLRR